MACDPGYMVEPESVLPTPAPVTIQTALMTSRENTHGIMGAGVAWAAAVALPLASHSELRSELHLALLSVSASGFHPGKCHPR